MVLPYPNCSWIRWQVDSPLVLLLPPVRLTFQESLNLRNPAVFSDVFEVGNPSLCVEVLYYLWPPPYSTADKNQATRISEMTPNKLSLYIYRANHDFSQGPQIIGRQRVEKSRKKKNNTTIPPIKTCQMEGEDAYNSTGFQMYLFSSIIYETKPRNSRHLS